jgi:hypothetical protein
LLEVFGAGTACLVCPVGRILHRHRRQPAAGHGKEKEEEEVEEEVLEEELLQLPVAKDGEKTKTMGLSLMGRLSRAMV